jgi:eukaryotic-like serine/threonine-protein kinase
MNLTAGTTLQNGKYLINHVLGQCGLSLTLQGTCLPQKRSVVLKTLQIGALSSENFVSIQERFAEQIQQFSHCHHPQLVSIVDSFKESAIQFAVMEYIPGSSLAEWVRKNGALSEKEAIRYIRQIGTALAAVHQQGLSHRDVTPRNIIYREHSNDVVLVNFGLAHPVVLNWSNGFAHPPAGEYAAIEDYQAELASTPATDIYSLAGTLYFLITGHCPTAAPIRHTSPLLPPRHFCPALSQTTEAAILKGLELNPKNRPQTIERWLAQLESVEFDVSGATPSIKGGAIDARNGSDAPLIHPNPIKKVQNIEEVISKSKNEQHVNDRCPESTALGALSAISPPPQKMAKKLASEKAMTLSTSVAPKHKLSKTLVSFGFTASLVGLSFGLLLRLAAGSTGAGSSFFHAEQSFPSMQDWPGASVPSATVPPTETPPKNSPPPRTVPTTEPSSSEDSVATPSTQPISTPSSSPPADPSQIETNEVTPRPVTNPVPAPQESPLSPPAVVAPPPPPPPASLSEPPPVPSPTVEPAPPSPPPKVDIGTP